MLSVLNRLVPIHFAAVFFMLVCFWGVWVCSRFILLHCSLEQVHNLIQLSFCCLFSTSTFLPGLALAVFLTDVFIYQRLLSTQICAQNGFCCNVFCSDSARTRPLCSSCLSCWFVLKGLQLLYLAAFFLEQVHNLIQLWFCYIFQQVLSCLGLALAVFLTDVFIYRPLLSTQICAQNAFCCNAFCSDSARTRPLCSSCLSCWFVLKGLQPFYLAAFFVEQVQIWYSFHFVAFLQQVLSCLGLALAVFLTDVFIYRPLLSTQICAQNGFCCNAFCSDSARTRPLCSSCLSCWFVLKGLQLFYLAAFFVEQVQIWYSFHFAAFFQQVLSCLGLALAVFLTEVFIYRPLLSTQICAQNGFCCNAFCSDSASAHPLCSSCLSCWSVLGGFAVLSCCMFLRAST